MSDVFPEDMWERSIQATCSEIKSLSYVSDTSVDIFPHEPFPVPGLNPDIGVKGKNFFEAYPDSEGRKIDDKQGALFNRERMGFGVFEFTLNQPGFSKIEHDFERYTIAPHFRVRIFFPRDFPSQGVGYGFTFTSDGGFELPHYPNIMRRHPNEKIYGYWASTSEYSMRQVTKPYPNGCMCLNALNTNTPLKEVVGRVKHYLSVPPDQFIHSANSRETYNDRGFDWPLFAIFTTHVNEMNRILSDYQPPKVRPSPKPKNGSPPPPPPPARKGKKKPGKPAPPPPPPPKKRR